MTFSRLFEAVAHVDEIVRLSVAETRIGLLGARSSRLAPVVRFQTLARASVAASQRKGSPSGADSV